MNIFHRYALESMKKNKVRTIVTVIGIILSLSLFTAVLEGAYSGVMFLRKSVEEEVGRYHGFFGKITAETAEMIAQDKEIDEYELTGYVGLGTDQAGMEYSIESVNPYSDMYKIKLVSGRMPENSSEIVIPQRYMSRDESLKTGDTLIIMTGPDLSTDDVKGLSTEELAKKTAVKEYIVTGFVVSYSMDVTSYTCGETTDLYNCYYTLKKPSSCYKFVSEQKYTEHTYDNWELLRLYGVVRSDSISSMIYGFAAALVLIISFGSVSLIYNSFSVSVSERTKQFGILKSIGATKKQIRSGVLYEALVLSLTAVPAGLLLGCGGMGITLWKLSDKFSSVYGNTNVKMKMVLNVYILIAACFVSILTVLISAWIPASRAVRITPLEAVRQSGDYRTGKQKKRSVFGRIFGFEGMMASRNFGRNKRRNRSVVFSLAASVILFITAKSFCIYIENSISDTVMWTEYTPDVVCSAFGGETPDMTGILSKIRSDEKTERAFLVDKGYIYVDISRDMLTRDYNRLTGEENYEIEDYNKMIALVFTDDEFFRELCRDFGYKDEKYFDSSSPKAVMYNYAMEYSAEKKRESKIRFIASDPEISFSEIRESGNYIHHVADYISTDAMSVNDVPYLIYPYSMKNIVLSGEGDDFFNTNIYINAEDHKSAAENIQKIIDSENIRVGVHDVADTVESEKNLVTVINVLATGFIVIIALISAANIINTVSTNMQLRRREFAMLRSVGLSSRSFDKMMNIECLIYGLKSLIWSLPVSVLTTFGIFQIAERGIYTDYYYPAGTAFFAAVCVFAVVFVSMIFAAGRIRNENTVDALRNENI